MHCLVLQCLTAHNLQTSASSSIPSADFAGIHNACVQTLDTRLHTSSRSLLRSHILSRDYSQVLKTTMSGICALQFTSDALFISCAMVISHTVNISHTKSLHRIVSHTRASLHVPTGTDMRCGFFFACDLILMTAMMMMIDDSNGHDLILMTA